MMGKFLGGFSLLITIEAVMVAIGVFLGLAFFGPQKYLQFAFVILGGIIYSSLLFFSLTFMFSELLRKSTLAILTAIGVFAVSLVLYSALLVLYALSTVGGAPNEFYLNLSKMLPIWSASNLPTFIASEVMPMLKNPFVSLTTGDVALAALIIAVYAVVSILIASIRLVKSDVAKKID